MLLYHRLVAEPRAVAPSDFDAQMERLHELGFEAVTLDTYVRFMRGDPVGLPKRPILITFDDGYLSSWENADPVLARYGWSAAMYIPTGFVGLPGHLSWDQLRLLQASGRWQIDEHAGDGHVSIPVDAAGRRSPFYAAERWVDGKQESFTEYQRRVGHDVELGARLLSRNLPGWHSHGTFAVPFGDYGQRGSNDPRIETWFSGYLRAHFAVSFVQAPETVSTRGLGFADRIPVSGTWNADVLEMHLMHGLDRFTARTAGGRSRG